MAGCKNVGSKTSPSSVWDWNPNHKQRMKNLLNTGFLSDINLFVGPKKIPFKAHKLILQTGSPVFHSKISESDYSLNAIYIDEAHPKIFALLLEFLYTGELGSEVKESEALLHLDLLKISSEYKVGELSSLCSKRLTEAITDENALLIFRKSMDYDITDLRNQSINYINKNAWKLVDSEEFLKLPSECLNEAIKSDDLTVNSELQLFLAVMRWGEEECKRRKLEAGEPHNMRNVLSDVLGLIRFPVMDQTDFTLNVALSKILVTEELVSILLYFTVPMDKRSVIPPGRFNSKPRHYKKVKPPSLSYCPLLQTPNASKSGFQFQSFLIMVTTEMTFTGFGCSLDPSKSAELRQLRHANGGSVYDAYWMISYEIKMEGNTGRKVDVPSTGHVNVTFTNAQEVICKDGVLKPSCWYLLTFNLFNNRYGSGSALLPTNSTQEGVTSTVYFDPPDSKTGPLLKLAGSQQSEQDKPCKRTVKINQGYIDKLLFHF